jgi:YfiH family protein
VARLLTSPLLESIGVPHAFTTRQGGVSTGPFASLNLGNPSDLPRDRRDPPENIRRNWRIILDTLGLAGRELVQVHQVHAGDVLVVETGRPAHAGASDTRADALVTADPARVLAVRVADCAPVLITSADGGLVSAIHAGWRGVLADAVINTVAAMRRLGAHDLAAAIGPCLSVDAFEVGPDVAERFAAAFGTDAGVVVRGPDKPRLDLKLALSLQLRAAGVERVDVLPHCTYRRADLFYSHRRDRGVTGRGAGVIGPRA